MANWWEKNLTDKQKFRLQEPKDPSLLDVVSTVPNPVGDVASGLLAAQDVSKGNYGTAALNALGLLPFVPSMGGVVKNVGKEVNAYPLAPAGTRYEEYSGNLTYMTPDEYLRNVRPLTLDESSLDNIADLKRHVESGGKLDPLAIYPNGKEDGRHRAYLAKELGINQVPVALHGRTKYEIQQATAQKNATLPVSKGGLGLPVNNTAMDRANAMGYTTPAYHGTARIPEGINSFDFLKGRTASGNRDGLIGTFSTDNPKVASDFADFAGYMQNSNVMPLMLKQENPWKPNNYREISDLIDNNTNFASKDRYGGQPLRMSDDVIDSNAARKELMDKGYDSIFLEKTLVDSPDQLTPINQYVSIKPENIRSRFAAFDPFRRNEADILAGVAPLAAGSLLGLNTYNNMQEKPKKEKKKTK